MSDALAAGTGGGEESNREARGGSAGEGDPTPQPDWIHWRDITATEVRVPRPDEPGSPPTTDEMQAGRHKFYIQSFAFARAVQEIHPPLIPLTVPLPSTPIVLYHATREEYLLSFRRYGIDPRRYYGAAASFNLADSVEAAVAHVLHGNPTVRNPSTGAVTDPIMVLAFQLRLDTMKNKIMLDEAAELANDEKRGVNKLPTDHDFVISPFLIQLKGKRYGIADAWAAAGKTPTHVAAVSANALKLLNKSLIAIYVELRFPR
ncbi:hypothetical protein DFH06DRAFT_624006 [Mycena polygramma]|nr:hypothetical protein DFH06DRAFT_624006 [Mycena polygramma]